MPLLMPTYTMLSVSLKARMALRLNTDTSEGSTAWKKASCCTSSTPASSYSLRMNSRSRASSLRILLTGASALSSSDSSS